MTFDQTTTPSCTFGRLYDPQLEEKQLKEFDVGAFEAAVQRVVRARKMEPTDIEPRLARKLVGEHEVAIGLLDAAIQTLKRVGISSRGAEDLKSQVSRKLSYLHYCASYRIEPRKVPTLKPRPGQHLRSTWHVYLDEAGTRSPNPQIGFKVFAVAAVVVERQHYLHVVEPKLEELKRRFWGDRFKEVTLHEPEMRQHEDDFSFGGDVQRQQEFDVAYAQFLTEIEFYSVAAVLDKVRVRDIYGAAPIDQYLPRSLYAMAYDFVLERTCHLLHFECDDGQGSVFPESIGTREDAELQYEHARIFIEGTRYVPGKWFQYQLQPGLRFFRKGQAVGIELADTVARTVADHANGLGSASVRWNVLADKLYAGHMDRPHRWRSYKLFPPTK